MLESNDEKARLSRQMSREAIDLAMRGRWREAVAVNQSIIESVPTDVDAYNRLGKAHMELGEYDKAKEAYHKALELSANNMIARKNLTRLAQLENAKIAARDERPKADPNIFIGEVGKAKVVNLNLLAAEDVLAKITEGDQVKLKISGHGLIAESEDGEYIGQVENQHGFRLAKLMEGGNKYAAAIVSLEEKKVKIIIRETYQHPSQIGKLSFPAKAMEGFQPHVKDAILRDTIEEEEYVEESEEGEEEEEGEMLPEGFSIFERGMQVESMGEEGLMEDDEQ